MRAQEELLTPSRQGRKANTTNHCFCLMSTTWYRLYHSRLAVGSSSVAAKPLRRPMLYPCKHVKLEKPEVQRSYSTYHSSSLYLPSSIHPVSLSSSFATTACSTHDLLGHRVSPFARLEDFFSPT